MKLEKIILEIEKRITELKTKREQLYIKEITRNQMLKKQNEYDQEIEKLMNLLGRWKNENR